MRAAGAHGVVFVVYADDEHFAVLDAGDFSFDFFHVGDGGEGGEIFEEVFLEHFGG